MPLRVMAKRPIEIMTNPVIRISFSPSFLSAKVPTGISNSTNGSSAILIISPSCCQEKPRDS